jgi:C4-dicarboxylate-specific signal transduction histidine kinase/ABC-type uncharacterized transport system substrate-binding protein
MKKNFISLAALVCLCSLPQSGWTAEAAPAADLSTKATSPKASPRAGPRHVLLVHSFGRDFSPYTEVAREFRARLTQISPEPIEFVETSLEMARFDGADRDRPLLDFLRAIYARQPLDLIVPVCAPAAMFCMRHRNELFPNVPILLLAAEKRRIAQLTDMPHVASVALDLDLTSYLKNILQVLPATEHVYVVMGTGPLERYWEEALKREWAGFENRVTFHWLSDQPMRHVAKTVENLPPHSVVFVGIVNVDAAGAPHETESALRTIREHSNAPIFGWSTSQLGQGIVGGMLAPMLQVGREGADVAARILGGEPAEKITPVELRLTQPIFDGRELRRRKIPEQRLASNATILFREPSLWEAHRRALLLTLGLIAMQTFFIGWLLAARRRATEADANLAMAAAAAKVGLWHRRAKSDLVTASAQCREILDLPRRGPLSMKQVLGRLHPDDSERVQQAIEDATRNGGNFALEHRIVRSDGTVRWVASHGRLQPAGKGDSFDTRGASIDITKRREAEINAELQRDELAHFSRVSSLGVLSGALAHELNQPLGSILANAQAAETLLEAKQPDLVELREILADIVGEDRRAGDVIKCLRALLRRGESSLQSLDVNESVRDVLRLARSDLIRKGVTVESHFAPNLPKVMSDRVQLQQVVLNLIVNACDAMKDNSRQRRTVTIETSNQNDEVRIAVHDRGIGLPDDVEQLFQPFRTTKPTGLGMGLAICRTLITAHGGRLWAEPRTGGGASLFVALPCETEAA